MEYRNSKELEGWTLKYGDYLYFFGEKYRVCYGYLGNTSYGANDTVFTNLGIEKVNFCKMYYGYAPRNFNGRAFPECGGEDFKALTRVALALFKEIEKREGIELSYFDIKVGDTVIVKSDLHEGDYRTNGGERETINIVSDMLEYKGRLFTIQSKNSSGFTVEEAGYIWPASAFSKIIRRVKEDKGDSTSPAKSKTSSIILKTKKYTVLSGHIKNIKLKSTIKK